MEAETLAPGVARSSATLVLVMQDKCTFAPPVFLIVCTTAFLGNYKDASVLSCFLKQIQHDKGWGNATCSTEILCHRLDQTEFSSRIRSIPWPLLPPGYRQPWYLIREKRWQFLFSMRLDINVSYQCYQMISYVDIVTSPQTIHHACDCKQAVISQNRGSVGSVLAHCSTFAKCCPKH